MTPTSIPIILRAPVVQKLGSAIHWINLHSVDNAIGFPTGADPGVFLGGGALVSCSTSTPINPLFCFFFFCRIPAVVLENRRSSHGEGGGVHPLHPPPRSAPALILIHWIVLSNFYTTGAR